MLFVHHCKYNCVEINDMTEREKRDGKKRNSGPVWYRFSFCTVNQFSLSTTHSSIK